MIDPIPADQLLELVQYVDSLPQYKVLRRLPEPDSYGDVSQSIRVLVIDTETTGVDHNTDKIIEIGAVLVEADPETGQIGRVINTYSGLEDPGFPIPPQSTAIHGITDEMVKGQRFDDAAMHQLLDGVQLVLAHNAAFDRPFLENRFRSFETLPWGCTFKQINWNDEGFGSSKLEFIVYKLGYFFDAHRAVTDCYALLTALAHPLPKSGMLPVALLVQAAEQKEFVIYALNSPFETKDALRNKGFRWDADLRAWKIPVLGKAAGDETIQWLKNNIYNTTAKVSLGFQVSVATDRFSNRPTNYSTKLV